MQQIAITIDEYAKKENRKMSFNNFIKSDLRVISETIAKYFLNINSALDNLASYSLNDKVQRVIHEYLKHIFNEYEIVFVIESIEKIDETSLQIIKELLASTNNNKFIFEYTLTDENDNKHFGLWDQFSHDNILSVRHKLDPLGIDECKKLCNKIDLTNQVLNETFEMIYKNSRGNLYAILHFDPQIDKVKSLNLSYNYDTTKQRINNLKNEQLYSLIMIELHNGEIHKDIFEELICTSDYMHSAIMHELLEDLRDKDMIIECNNTLLLHDSLLKEIRTSEHAKGLRTKCYSDIIRLYDDIKSDLKNRISPFNIEYNELLINEIQLHLQFDITSLFLLKDEVDSLNKNKNSVDVMQVYIKSLINCRNNYLKKRIKNEVDKFIIIEGYKLGLFNDIYSVLQDCDIEIKIRDLFLSLVEAHKGNVKESNKIVTSYSKTANLEKRFSFLFKLVYQINLLSYSSTEEAVEYSENILLEYLDEPTPEYGVFLRNYATLLNYSDAIPYLDEAITSLKKEGNYIAAGQTMITLASRLTYVGELEKAGHKLDESENLLRHTNFRIYYLLNNKAVVNIFSNQLNRSTEKYLVDAYHLVQHEYDLILILINLITYYCKIGYYKKSSYYIGKLDEIDFSKYTNSEFLVEIYRVKLANSLLSKNIKSSLRIINRIREIEDDSGIKTNEDIYAQLVNENFTDASSSSYIKTLKPIFITYWSFDIPQEIENLILN